MTHRREPRLFGEVVNAAEKRKPEDEPGGSEGSRKCSKGGGGTGLKGHRNEPERARSQMAGLGQVEVPHKGCHD